MYIYLCRKDKKGKEKKEEQIIYQNNNSYLYEVELQNLFFKLF